MTRENADKCHLQLMDASKRCSLAWVHYEERHAPATGVPKLEAQRLNLLFTYLQLVADDVQNSCDIQPSGK
jgi:hypothetical protein